MKSVNEKLLILENKDFSSKVDDLKLFTISQNKNELKNFVPSLKFTSTTLEPLNRDMSLSESAHLLRRTIIGPTIEEINAVLAVNTNQAVNYLLRDIPSPNAPGQWVDYPIPNYQNYTNEQIDSLFVSWQDQQIELANLDAKLKTETLNAQLRQQAIAQIRIGQRSSFYCQNCQK